MGVYFEKCSESDERGVRKGGLGVLPQWLHDSLCTLGFNNILMFIKLLLERNCWSHVIDGIWDLPYYYCCYYGYYHCRHYITTTTTITS